MTTIAYRSGILAADSRACLGNYMLPGDAPKIRRRANDGWLFATHGHFATGEAWMDWMMRGGGLEFDLGDDTTGIAFRPDGLAVVYEGKHVYRIHAPFHAYGSGMGPALGALHMGASAEQAVEIACLVDPGSGGPVVTLTHEAVGEIAA